MTPKEQAFKMIEGKIEAIQTLSIECIDFIYLAAHNEAIELAALIVQPNPHVDEERRCEDIAAAIRSLKVESTDQIGLKK